MSAVASAVLESWTMPPAIVIPALTIALLYVRGVRRVRTQMPAHFPGWRVAAFLAGLVMLVVALASPLDAFGGLLLWAHMLQHVILMLVANCNQMQKDHEGASAITRRRHRTDRPDAKNHREQERQDA